ncbi:MAG: CoA transferase subunit A [Desulfobacterales bacterium]|nr:CoA transferase subunit A [Desulfobacteraceae bacterium]MBT7086497.1 CoA transferase subunit A [Desulfobacterales bacterium]MBT7697572.1 CoA transferase subunit A [Desulfobacterales bacterium]
MNIIDQGIGPLFMDPDPDKARAFFRTKKRKMKNKVMELKDAIKEFVHDGDYLGMGGFGANRTPVAACHEIVRQGRKKMGFAGHTATHDMEILSAGEVYDRLDVAYVVGLEARGLSPCSRKYVESGKVEVTEWTNYSLTARLKAAAMGVPFVPIRNIMGTDTFKYSASKIIECPYTGKKLAAMPALYPDVSVIHVHEADIYGNSRFKGIAVSDLDLANASKRLIITTEKLITHDEIARDPSSTRIPFHLVDAVCEVPFGAYPGTMPYEYFSDEDHLKEWMSVEKDSEKFKEFLDKNLYTCADHEEYIARNGGSAKMRELRVKEMLIYKEK